MHLDYIRSFCRIAKVKSITKASGELHLSQPALSLQINCLESRFGTKLLERTNRGVNLTPAGALVYRHGQRMLMILESMEQELSDMSNPLGRVLTISTSPILGSFLLPIKMLDFSKAHPETKCSIAIKSVPDVIENVLDRTASFGLVEGPIPASTLSRLQDDHITIHPIGMDAIVPVCPRHSCWSNTSGQIELLPLIIPKKNSGAREAIDQGLADFNHSCESLNILMELDNSSAIATAVNSGAGIGLVPQITIANSPGLEILSIKELTSPLPFTLLYNASQQNDHTIQSLVDCLST